MKTRLRVLSRSTYGIVLTLGMCSLSGNLFAQQGPEVSLNVSELVSDISATQDIANTFENSLSEALERVDQQTQALKSAGCTPETQSAQCLSLKSVLKEDYMKVLDSVEERLPALRNSVNSVVENIEKRMGQQAGKSSNDIQSELLEASKTQNGSSVKPKLRLRGASGSRLSESLGRLQGIVASAGTSGVSLQSMQNDLYLDMRDSLRTIENLDAAIQNTRLIAAVQLGETTISDEQLNVAREAQGFIFGDAPATDYSLEAPLADPQSENGEWKSDLEL